MAQLYSTGPVDMFVWHAQANAPVFLGHGERAPSIEVTPSWVPVHCDLAGQAPMDTLYSGEMGRVSVELIRYNWATVKEMQDRAIHQDDRVATPGVCTPGDLGLLAVQEGSFYILYLRFQHAVKTAMSGMVGGYRFYAAVLEPMSVVAGSTTANKIHMTFNCYRRYLRNNSSYVPAGAPAVANNSFGVGTYILYDHNMSDIGVIG